VPALSPPVLKQLEEVQKHYPGATSVDLGNATFRIDVPNYELPAGWSKERVTIWTLLPGGYPVAQPDCFWTDRDLRLKDGRTPQNTGLQQLPGTGEQVLWFSWHLQVWNPNEHSILTWLRVIRKRFEQRQ
jgi:hypothetical protein